MQRTRKYSLGNGLCVHADGAEIQEHIDALIARAEKAEADLARIRTLLGYTDHGCTVCITADGDCSECPVKMEGKW